MILFYGMPHGEVEDFAFYRQDTIVSETGRRR